MTTGSIRTVILSESIGSSSFRSTTVSSQTTIMAPALTASAPTNTTTTASTANQLPLGKDGKPLKPCCACPETKKPRDQCILERGEENCGDLIEAHKQCMRSLGFKI
ncbi:hypothetical protein BC938DRAFT_475997 [Jimgerdemannia flammicorona]|uniref:Cytochrome c oxidase copper chaperone n=1 Tax=Jimgerdemannia flammicorona TaxID=994334 RepID=A0A433QR27_9FUNG|nr:hypothetical protein BC938DRAFT_475997 [Jimgerdemannia flammicorona]